MNHEELSDRLWRFAARLGKVVDALPDTRPGRHVAGQLVRCGTAAPPNYDEGSAAESKADFAHKLNVALKELVETRGWLKFIVIAELLSAHESSNCRMSAINSVAFWASQSPQPKGGRGHHLPINDSRFSIVNFQ